MMNTTLTVGVKQRVGHAAGGDKKINSIGHRESRREEVGRERERERSFKLGVTITYDVNILTKFVRSYEKQEHLHVR